MKKLTLPEEHTELIDAQRCWRRKLEHDRAAAYAATGEAKNKAVYRYMLCLSSEQRIAELVPLIENEAPEIFWKLFIDTWPMCDAAWEWQRKLVPIFRRVGPCPLEYVLYFWMDLPDQLTLYRGASRSRIHGAISWTIDRKVAEKFARGHRGIPVPDPVIATASINKAAIFAATNERGESEVLCLPHVADISPRAILEEKRE
jgi:hypothetical protein